MIGIEEQYKKLIENFRDAIYVCDASGKVKLFNNAAVELWGREPIVGKDLYCGSVKILNKEGCELSAKEHPLFITIKEKKSLENVEIVILRPDGSARNILHSTMPIYNIYGELTGVVSLISDQTDKA